MRELPRLVLESEWRLAALLDAPDDGRFEASGIATDGRRLLVVFDNTRRVARLSRDPARGDAAWIDLPGRADGFEDIAVGQRTHRFFLLVESVKSRGGYVSAIDEYDERWRLRRRTPIAASLARRNKGFEALTTIVAGDGEHLLAMPEDADNPTVLVLRRRQGAWRVGATMPLPAAARFRDYSAMSARGRRLAILSQKDARLWIGGIDPARWSIIGDGQTTEFPRSRKGKPKYCNLEGIAWLAADRFAVVSDRAKRTSQPRRCRRHDQSIHIFRLR